MNGQTRQQLHQREVGRRDYDRPTNFLARGSRACWKKTVDGVDGPCEGVVDDATENQSIVKGVPAGAMLCSEHAFLSDEELELLELVTDADRERFRAGKELHIGEIVLDLKHEQKYIDSEDGKWGGC